MRGGNTRVGQKNFFHICDAIRTHQEDIQKTCKKKRDAISYLVSKLQTPVPESTFDDACEAVKLNFEFSSGRENLRESAANNRRTILSAITNLYEQLGLALPADMRQLFEKSFGKPYREPIAGIPVNKVVQSATIPVANVKR